MNLLDRAAMFETNGAAPEALLPDGAVLVQLSTVEPEAVEWAWPGRIPRGKLTLIIGEPGDGKSQVSTDITARTTRGAPWPDDSGHATEGAVIILAAEDGIADTIRPRLNRQDGNCARVYVLRAVRIAGLESPFSLERD